METPEAIGEGWVFAAIAVAIPVCLFLMFRAFTAKTRKAYLVSYALVGLIMLALMVVFAESGLMPSREEIAQHQITAPEPQDVFSKLPTPMIVAFVIMGLIWVGGGNYIMMRQARKAGRSAWSILNPLNPPFRDMDRRSWLQLALLVFLGFAVFSVGVNLAKLENSQSPGSLSEPTDG